MFRESIAAQKVAAASAGHTVTWIRINHAERRSNDLIEKEEETGSQDKCGIRGIGICEKSPDARKRARQGYLQGKKRRRHGARDDPRILPKIRPETMLEDELGD